MKKHSLFSIIILFWVCITSLAFLTPIEANITMSFLTTTITMFTCGASCIVHHSIDCIFNVQRPRDEQSINSIIKSSNFLFAIGYFIYIFFIPHDSSQICLLHDLSRIILNISTIMISMSVTAHQVLTVIKTYKGSK